MMAFAVEALLLSLAIPLLCCGMRTNLYVKPTSPDTPCPADTDFCLTLSEYASWVYRYYDSNIAMHLISGYHTLEENYTVAGMDRFYLFGDNSSNSTTIIECRKNVGFYFSSITDLHIQRLAFSQCGMRSETYHDYFTEFNWYALFMDTVQSVEIVNCTFQDSFGTALGAYSSTLHLMGRNIFETNGVTCLKKDLKCRTEGGGIFMYYATLYSNGTLIFDDNSAALDGGGICARNSGLHLTGNVTFCNNAAKVEGGGIFAKFSTLHFTGNVTFHNNTANIEGNGGGIFAFVSTLMFNGKTTFNENYASHCGGGIALFDCTIDFLHGSLFIKNSAAVGGGIFSKNGVVHFTAVSNFNSFTHNAAKIFGGGIFAVSSTLFLMGESIFAKNTAEGHGAGVYADTSTVVFCGSSTLAMGFAYHDGGGIYAEDSTLNFTGNTTLKFNRARIGGGAVSVLGGHINFTGEIHFTNNSALRGGALYLEYKSSLRLSHTSVIHMVGNTAGEYGGAIYVHDVNPFGYCLPGVLPNTSENFLFLYTGNGYNVYGTNCFFEPPDSASEFWRMRNLSWRPKILFSANFAKLAGHALFGGSVDNCKLKERYAIHYTKSTDAYNSIFKFKGDSNIASSESMISSEPFRVCSCVAGDKKCSMPHISRQVYPGETFIVPAVTVGQRNGTVPSTIRASLKNQQSTPTGRVSMEIQDTHTSCSDLYVTVFSSVSHEELLLHTEGSCSVYGHPLHVALELLSCPPGFTLSERECICETGLLMYTNSCNITDRTVKRDGEYWLGYDNGSRELILHPHCPFDYCRLDSVEFVLTESDSQCRHNRSGLLCGHCYNNFSLALGTNRCLKCSNLYVLLLIAFAAAGVALVFLLLVCELTVASGTINGLIFYANIIAVNRTAVFPPDDVNILTVFIAFVNLDLGIETCFYRGLDAYAKTWLQYAFPLYVWIMVGAMILISDYSSKFARMLGTNPVAVLSTLFLLSYTKILRTIITTFSFTILEYPRSKVAVWLYDGNIAYIHGKHIPLFISAILVLLIFFLPYTCILLLSQWFQAKSNRRLFSWVNHIRVKPFIEAYHAPYQNGFRYWTGLMLLLRSGLFLIFAFNTYGDPSVNLLAIVVASVGAVWFIGRGRIYKYWWLDILEVSFFLNLGILAAGTLYTRAVTNGNQAALAYTSVSIAFSTFLGIIVYHTCLKFKVHIFGHIINHNLKKQARPSPEQCNLYDSGGHAMIAPTTTTIALRESLLQDTITS